MNNRPLFQKSILLFLLMVSSIAYYLLAYYTARENFLRIFSLLTVLFAVYLIAYRWFSITHFSYLLVAGIFFRLLLLFSIPNLSDDVYRFIWDGRLAANGINPFSHLPAEVMQISTGKGITKELFVQLNSPDYYSIYPPVLQGVFWFTAKVFPIHISEAIVFLKCFILLIDLAILFLVIQVLN